jgi:hypothetical protein
LKSNIEKSGEMSIKIDFLLVKKNSLTQRRKLIKIVPGIERDEKIISNQI